MSKYFIIALLGLVLWFLETWYFGFNWTAQTGQEKFADTLVTILIVYGLLGDLLKGLVIQKVVNIKTEKLTYTDNGSTLESTEDN